MERRELDELLSAVASGEISIEDASVRLRIAPYTDLGFAKVDHHRGMRQGASEVVFGSGKTADQIAGIVASMLEAGQNRVLITRLDAIIAEELLELLTTELAADLGCPTDGVQEIQNGADYQAYVEESRYIPPIFTYYDLPRIATVGEAPEPDGAGDIVVACGGTSDIYVAEEAALTAEMLGNHVVRLYDVGVSGLHRLLSHSNELARARVVVAVAGMEGALASVVAGMVTCPVIAVPTSVGYGASFGGLSALLTMLNSCASGVSVVNIDNGFGAGYQASLINHL